MSQNKMGFNATWSMAVGGMVGGGIFSVLGVIVNTAGKWAWLSFLLAGLVALISAHSYSQLSLKYKQGGGAFTFLNEINHRGVAGSLSWLLILGYILTISVYAFTFGHYVAHVFDIGTWFPRFLAFLIILFLAVINMKGVGEASNLEIITVWGKLIVLIGLSVIGIYHWDSTSLTPGDSAKSWHAAVLGAATIFMAYEGFQLLSYDYEDIQKPEKNLPRATITAVITVIFIYIVVALGATMLVGADTLIEQKEVALSMAGQKAMGTSGLILVTIAAAFSTASAINATLFSTGRLMETVAKKRALPAIFTKENKANIPYIAISIVASIAIILAIIGSLGKLVDAASFIFLITFGIVNFIAFKQKVKWRLFCLIGSLSCLIAIVLMLQYQWQKSPVQLLILLGVAIFILVGRPLLLKRK